MCAIANKAARRSARIIEQSSESALCFTIIKTIGGRSIATDRIVDIMLARMLANSGAIERR